MWENITSGDIEQAKHSLNLRRAETLSRHAEELKALDTEQSEVDNLASAIEAFMSKYRGSVSSETTTESAAAEPPNSNRIENKNFDVDEHNRSRAAGVMNFRAFG